MKCHTCGTPQPDAAVISAAASINGKRNAGKGSRPGAKGLVRNPKGRPKAQCPSCGYTKEDAQIHMDHHLCKNAGNAPWESNTFPLARKKDGDK